LRAPRELIGHTGPHGHGIGDRIDCGQLAMQANRVVLRIDDTIERTGR
jgi:hypothetical protein